MATVEPLKRNPGSNLTNCKYTMEIIRNGEISPIDEVLYTTPGAYWKGTIYLAI